MVSAPNAEKAARFASAEAMRWLKWGARSYHDFALGLAFLLIAAAIVRSGGVPWHIGYLMGLSGLTYLMQRQVVGAEGFSATHTILILVAWVLTLADVYTELPGWRTFYSLYIRGESPRPVAGAGRHRPHRLRHRPSGLPPAERAKQKAILSTAAYCSALHDEIAQLRTSLTQGQQVTSFGDRPLIVVTAGNDAQAGWLPLQDKMVQLSSNRVHRV